MSDHANIKILGYQIFSGDKEFFSGKISGVINTISPHSYIVARKDILFQKALLASDFVLPDGIGIVMAARFINRIKIKRIAGSDLHEVIIASLNRTGGSCFYLGSSDLTLGMIKKKLSHEQPAVKVGSYSPPYKPEFSDEEDSMMIKIINEFNPEVLFVGMTAPKQEKWVYKNRNKLNAPVICSIGAVFDFYAGTVTRSGKFWINLGLEWFPRLLREPGRLWRRNFISNPVFVMYVLIEKIRAVFSPDKSGMSNNKK